MEECRKSHWLIHVYSLAWTIGNWKGHWNYFGDRRS